MLLPKDSEAFWKPSKDGTYINMEKRNLPPSPHSCFLHNGITERRADLQELRDTGKQGWQSSLG